MECYLYNGIKYTEEDLVKLLQSQQPKTRRILELQSDLFQKGRDGENLVSGKELTEKSISIEDGFTFEGSFYKKEGNKYFRDGIEIQPNIAALASSRAKETIQNKPSSDNQFLQLLNKDNNWVTFFIKSIIQDSAKKGYEKVLFPTGNTASKVEGHTTLEEENNTIDDRIKTLEFAKTKDHTILRDLQRQGIKIFTPNDNIDVLNQHDYQGVNKGTNLDVYSKEESENPNYIYKALADKKYTLEDVLNRSIEYEKNRKQYLEKEGFGALKPIYNFYENTVTNILKKQGYNPKVITDEYGNTWNEVIINQARDLANILLQKDEYNRIIGQANIKAMTVLIAASFKATDLQINNMIKEGLIKKEC